MKIVRYALILFFLIYNSMLFATTYMAVGDGSWTLSTNWSPVGIPGDGDNVVIDGHTITHNLGTINVDEITITNSSNTGVSNLTIEGTGKIIVKNNMYVTSENFNHDIRLIIQSSGELEIGGDMNYERKSNNTQSTRCQLYMLDNAKLTVTGSYYFYYRNGSETNRSELWIEDNTVVTIGGDFVFERSGTGTGRLALDLRGNAQLNLGGLMDVNLTGGSTVDFQLYGDVLLAIGGNLNLSNSGGTNKAVIYLGDGSGLAELRVGATLQLNSSASSKLVELYGNNSKLTISGDLSFSALSASTVKMQMTTNSIINLAGAILRPNNFGILEMGSSATLNLNGTQPQTLAPNNLSGSGTDSLFYTNITFNNTSGSATTLTGPLVVEDNLAMDGGIIVSSSSNPIILADNATIGTGSSTSYIDGPVIKKGRTGAGGLTLPTGKGTIYSPISISEISSADGEITAEYFSEPPPFGNDINNFESGIENISQQGYWSIEKNEKAGNINYTLHWTDAEGLGINDLSTLIVVGLENSKWTSFGQESTTGGVGSGIEGSITSAYAEPPPFGVEALTLGSSSASNKLPVELSKFVAIPKGDKVELQWQTEAEIDFSHFIIERSSDGSNFERIGSVMSMGDINSTTDYQYSDASPLDGWNYYRLKIVDLDETYEYSNVEVVKVDRESNLEIYPNPVKDKIQIKGMDWGDDQILFEVFDKYGNLVYLDWITFTNGYFEIEPDTINIDAKGVYFIRLSGNFNHQILKFIKSE